MPLSEKALQHKTEYSIEYAKNNYKRIPLDMRIDDYERLKEAAAKAGEKINVYIKNAINLRMNHTHETM